MQRANFQGIYPGDIFDPELDSSVTSSVFSTSETSRTISRDQDSFSGESTIKQEVSLQSWDDISLKKIKSETFDSKDESETQDTALEPPTVPPAFDLPVVYQFQLVNYNRIQVNLKKAELDLEWYQFQQDFKLENPGWSLSVASLFYKEAAAKKIDIVNRWWQFLDSHPNPEEVKPVALDY